MNAGQASPGIVRALRGLTSTFPTEAETVRILFHAPATLARASFRRHPGRSSVLLPAMARIMQPTKRGGERIPRGFLQWFGCRLVPQKNVGLRRQINCSPESDGCCMLATRKHDAGAEPGGGRPGAVLFHELYGRGTDPDRATLTGAKALAFDRPSEMGCGAGKVCYVLRPLAAWAGQFARAARG